MAKRPSRTSPRPPTRPLIPPINVSDLKTYPLKKRQSKVGVADFAKPWKQGGSFTQFYRSLPDILGLNPIIVDWMKQGIVSAVAMNGAGIIHDFELALMGHTSEEVDAEIDEGRFGMAEETGRILNEAIIRGARDHEGLGEAVGNHINQHAGHFPHRETSILATGSRLGIPVTVHVAVGTDIIHMHPSADGAAIGATSLLDFRRLAAVVADMEGGVYLNLGSAVILPEVFLKTVSLGRNLGHSLTKITTVNMDFLSHYRPATNVVRRPTQKGGMGYSLIGHHEIMVPLLAATLQEELG